MKQVVICLSLCLVVFLHGCGSSRSLSASFKDVDAGHDFKSSLREDRQYEYGDVDVTVFEGRLMLTGTTPDAFTRDRLIERGWQVEGIKQIIDEVIVGEKTRFGQGVSDGRIDTAIRSKLIRDGMIRSSDVKITVSNGVAYLIGVARDEAVLNRVVELARSTRGVNKVVSHIIFTDEGLRRL